MRSTAFLDIVNYSKFKTHCTQPLKYCYARVENITLDDLSLNIFNESVQDLLEVY